MAGYQPALKTCHLTKQKPPKKQRDTIQCHEQTMQTEADLLHLQSQLRLKQLELDELSFSV